jgi:uncharacterized protein (UPF0264 family)
MQSRINKYLNLWYNSVIRSQQKEGKVMEVTAQNNSYQMLNAYQQKREMPVTTPVEPKDPNYKPGDVYEASNGNLISDKTGNVYLTPQGQNNLNDALDAKKTEATDSIQEQKDSLRAYAMDYTAAQSKKSQAEIYLSVATDSDVDLTSGDTASVIENLREVQKQNNTVEAYATYKQNQNASQLGFVV